MKRKLNLSEELYKMRKLMSYDSKKDFDNVTSYDRLMEEKLVEKYLLSEQAEVVTDKYGEYDFSGTFPDNYTTPKKESYEPIIKKMIEDYKKAISEGKRLEDVTMSVESSASSRRASNRYTESAPPNHDYGGLLKKYSPEGWVKVGKGDKKIIPAGNKFLAEQRGETLKNIVIQSLNGAGIKIDSSKVKVDWKVSDSPDQKEQYVKVLVKGLFEKKTPPPGPPPTTPKPKEKYSIVVDWYKIGGSQTPYILIGRVSNTNIQKSGDKLNLWAATIPGGPEGSKWGIGERFREALKSSGDDVKVGGFNFRAVNPNIEPEGTYFFKAFGVIEKYTRSQGNIFYFKDKLTWMDQVKKMNKITPQAEVDKLNFNGSDKGNKFDETIYAKGNYGDDFGQANFSGGFSVGTANNTFYGLKPSSGEPKNIKDIKEQFRNEKGFYYGEPVKLVGYKAVTTKDKKEEFGQATQPETKQPRIQ